MKSNLLLAIGLFIIGFNSWASPVNVNTADAKSIADALTNIGIKKAEAIIKYREEKGPFKTAEDLLNVPGIGEKTLEKNRADILLGDDKTSAPKLDTETQKTKK